LGTAPTRRAAALEIAKVREKPDLPRGARVFIEAIQALVEGFATFCRHADQSFGDADNLHKLE
jgi:hypothetical protein